MIVEIKVPSPGESITEVEIGHWLVEDGAVVAKNQEIAEVESDKATLTIIASEAGKLLIKAAEGEKVAVGAVVCTIDSSFKGEAKPEKITEEKVEAGSKEKTVEKLSVSTSIETDKIKVTDVAREMMKEHGLSIEDIISGLKRIGKKEVEIVLQVQKTLPSPVITQKTASRGVDREKMTSLRRKLSERLVAVKNETAMLTTFNEIDMSFVMDLRTKYQQKFT